MRVPGPTIGLVAAALGAATSINALEAPSVPIRGLDPALLPLYAKNSTHFLCLSTSKSIPLSAINDDYCDCPDGSDEPGTSACEGRGDGATTFYCKNEGHIPGAIGLGRVNDGICDDECCDGSDEWATGACPDRCQEIGKEYRAKIAAEAQTRKTGAKIRGTYIKHAKTERKRLEDEIAKKQVEVGEKESEVERLRISLEGLEAKSHVELEKRKQSSDLSAIFQTLLSQRNLLSRLRAQTSSLQKELDDLHNILDELRKGYNPNYQDMAVKAAVVGYEELTRGPEAASSTDSEETAEGSEAEKEKLQEAQQKDVVEKVSEWELDQAERKDLEGLLLEDMDSADSASGVDDEEGSVGILYKIDEYIPDFLFESFDNFRETLAEWLVKLGIFGKVAKVGGGGGGNDAPHTSAARQKYTNAQNDLNRIKREITTAQETLDNISGWEYGREGEWKKLDGKCVEKIHGDYTYELCFFGSATQKSNKDYSNNHLGQYTHWNSNFEPGSYDFYTEQGYRNGAKCWNGPNRSVDVILSCGTKNELLTVSEPEKCEYRFTVTTPALCWPITDVPGGEGPGAVVLAQKGREEL